MSKTDKFKEYICGKRTAVIGLGKSNIPLVDFLLECGADVSGHDRRTEGFDELKEKGVRLCLGENYLDELDYDLIFKTPAMHCETPELLSAVQKGAVLTSEMELFFNLCPAKIIGITGSDGKTTTTTIIAKILEKHGYKVWLGGNIGRPLIGDVCEMSADDFAVVELSSFQLHTMRVSPDVAVITNISPNHLDMHKSYAEYISAKENIMRYQGRNTRLIVNFDNEVTRKIGAKANGECIYFSSAVNSQICVIDNKICVDRKPILDIRDIKILGKYNVENYMAAIGAVYDFVSSEDIVSTAAEFGGVAHRTEFVREYNGVKYYDSSIDSSPNRTQNTLSVFDDRVVLICGGRNKGLDYTSLGEVIAKKVRVLILIGENIGDIKKSLDMYIESTGTGNNIMIIYPESYEQAVKYASKCAERGECVVLSPASTSFDRFADFEKRGELFKKLVLEL